MTSRTLTAALTACITAVSTTVLAAESPAAAAPPTAGLPRTTASPTAVCFLAAGSPWKFTPDGPVEGLLRTGQGVEFLDVGEWVNGQLWSRVLPWGGTQGPVSILNGALDCS